jgi:hypothetical protein
VNEEHRKKHSNATCIYSSTQNVECKLVKVIIRMLDTTCLAMFACRYILYRIDYRYMVIWSYELDKKIFISHWLRLKLYF